MANFVDLNIQLNMIQPEYCAQQNINAVSFVVAHQIIVFIEKIFKLERTESKKFIFTKLSKDF
jgi:hypothetical protein